MGMTPREVGSMMLWEFMSCVEEFSTMNGAKKKLSDAEKSEIRALIDAAPDTVTD